MNEKPIQIAVHFPAGGTGKSTTTWAIASYLALKFRVLCIDLDAQGSLTNSLVNEIVGPTSYEVLSRKIEIEEAIVSSSDAYPDSLHVVCGSSKLSGLDVETAANIERHYLLLDAIDNLQSFDFVICDTPPTTGLGSVVSLTSSYLLAPIETSAKAWDQIQSFDHLYQQIKRRINPKLEILGVVPTRVENTILSKETHSSLREHYGQVLTSPIKKTVRLSEAMAQGVPPWRQNTSKDYLTLTNELLRRLNYGEKEIPEADCFS